MTRCLNQALGNRVFDTHHFFLDTLKDYPKCSRCIRISQPDLQGPFDIAHLLIGNEVFLGVYDFPEFLHELLEVVADTYIAFRKGIQGLLTDAAGDDAVYVHGCIFGGKVLLKDDTAIANLSEEMYREFSRPYNERIYAAFGGGSVHYCGPSRAWTHEAIAGPLLRGVNYGNPESQDLAGLHSRWSPRKVPNLLWGDSLCGYRQDCDFLGDIRASGIRTGMTLAIRVDNYEEARLILERHKRQSAEP